jgi:hypothetical protein
VNNSNEIPGVIDVPETPLPTALTNTKEFELLSENGRREFLAHIRFMQELPYKLREWLVRGANAEDLRDLILTVDLDISTHIGTPEPARMECSAFAIRDVWVRHHKPLVTRLAPKDAAALNMSVPAIGAALPEISGWINEAANSLDSLFDGFFKATDYDDALAYVVAIHVYMAGIKFGLGRVEMRYPR